MSVFGDIILYLFWIQFASHVKLIIMKQPKSQVIAIEGKYGGHVERTNILDWKLVRWDVSIQSYSDEKS